MIYLILCVLGIGHEFFQFFTKEMNFPQVEWPEIGKEWLIDQVVINAEVKRMGA